MTHYLKGLNTLRAIAALVVVFVHIELLKQDYSIPNLLDANFFIFPSAHIAVIFFFVLSGFLITYLLTIEKETTGTISIKQFLMRRVLRILPLYYIVLLLSYLLVESEYTTKTVVLSATIFPNIARALGEGWPSSPQIWSIGVEEQFYLIWPFILVLLPSRKVILYLIIFFVLFTLLPHVIGFLGTRNIFSAEFSTFSDSFFHDSKFNCLALGALFGYSLGMKKPWLEKYKSSNIIYPLIVLAFALWFFKFRLTYFTEEFYAILFGFLILGVVITDKFVFESKVLNQIGKLSFGIYMYHWIICILVFKVVHFNNNPVMYNVLLYFLILSATILVSYISFNTIEKYFLNLKKRKPLHSN